MYASNIIIPPSYRAARVDEMYASGGVCVAWFLRVNTLAVDTRYPSKMPPGQRAMGKRLACLQVWIVLQKTSVRRAIRLSSCLSKASRFRNKPVSSFLGSSGGPLQSISTCSLLPSSQPSSLSSTCAQTWTIPAKQQ